jgi:hypothetical protein
VSRTVIIATDDRVASPYAEMRGSAVRWAAREGARVILYDRSAESYFLDPYPRGPWTADVEGAPLRESLLAPAQLEPLGRHYLAEQVGAVREEGLDAYAWLPTRPGVTGMADAVERFGADLVILPSSLERPSLIDRVRGNTLERFRAGVPTQVAIAGPQGVELVPAGS